MGAAYSQDLRDRVIGARDRGMATSVIARTFNVSAPWVRRVMQRRREHGETTPRACGGCTHTKIDHARLRELVEQTPDATLAELRRDLGHGSLSGIDAALRRMKLSLKKRRSTPRSRIGPMWPANADAGSADRPSGAAA
jgi:transposase